MYEQHATATIEEQDMTKRKPAADDPVFTAGLKEGRRQAVAEVLTYLQNRYMDRAVVRGSSLGIAILQVAADLSKHIKEIYVGDIDAAREIKH